MDICRRENFLGRKRTHGMAALIQDNTRMLRRIEFLDARLTWVEGHNRSLLERNFNQKGDVLVIKERVRILEEKKQYNLYKRALYKWETSVSGEIFVHIRSFPY